MRGVCRAASEVFRGIGFAFLALAWSPPASGAPAGAPGTAMSSIPETDFAVRMAIRRAHDKLSQANCRLVYDDFQDGSGRTLRANLDERGQSAADHFSSLVFDGGDGRPPCKRQAILAFTSPGASSVHVCTRQFMAVFHADTERAVASLIHEQLHTLGLGENPPTSLEITERVLLRCRW